MRDPNAKTITNTALVNEMRARRAARHAAPQPKPSSRPPEIPPRTSAQPAHGSGGYVPSSPIT
ncbi:hypothetical protein BH11MYX4_BH11MYX4_37170 [soil metagenome]|nr:hypothetical protein [Labilithrix sp.]